MINLLPSFGIDTIRIQITADPKLIRAFLAQCVYQTKKTFSHPNLPHVLVIKNAYSLYYLSLEFSVPKVAWDKEDNTCLAKPEDVRIALQKIQNITGFDTFNATIPRIDITLCWESIDPPAAYIHLFQDSQFFFKPEGKGKGIGFLKRSGYEIIPYDKASERASKGANNLLGLNINRIELRINQRASAFIKNKTNWNRGGFGEFYAGSLTINVGFTACLLAFQKTIVRDLQLNTQIKAGQVHYKSIRSLSLYKHLLSLSDESVYFDELSSLERAGRIDVDAVRNVLTDLRKTRNSSKNIAHALEIKSILESQLAFIKEKYPTKFRIAA